MGRVHHAPTGEPRPKKAGVGDAGAYEMGLGRVPSVGARRSRPKGRVAPQTGASEIRGDAGTRRRVRCALNGLGSGIRSADGRRPSSDIRAHTSRRVRNGIGAGSVRWGATITPRRASGAPNGESEMRGDAGTRHGRDAPRTALAGEERDARNAERPERRTGQNAERPERRTPGSSNARSLECPNHRVPEAPNARSTERPKHRTARNTERPGTPNAPKHRAPGTPNGRPPRRPAVRSAVATSSCRRTARGTRNRR